MNSEDDLDDGLQERELPDESDMDQDGEDDLTDTESCPHCTRTIYSQAQFCHYCGKAVSWERLRTRKPMWVVIIIALFLFLILISYLLSLLAVGPSH